MSNILIYGATGYTGTLACRYAKQIKLEFTIAGRTESKLQTLASELDVPYQTFEINNLSIVNEILSDVDILLNCAGPFCRTAEPLMEGCIRNRVHYLDIAAELKSYQLAQQLHLKAVDAGVMLMPGCGGSVAMLGCLVSFAIEGFKEPADINVALKVTGGMSRGSKISAAEGPTKECLHRVGNVLVEEDNTATQKFDFDIGKGYVECIPLTFPDLITIWKDTNVGNIHTYADFSELTDPDGAEHDPSFEEREATPYHGAVKITSTHGNARRSVLHTVNGYTFTSIASIKVIQKMSQGIFKSGFRTPAGMYGAALLFEIPGTSLKYI